MLEIHLALLPVSFISTSILPQILKLLFGISWYVTWTIGVVLFLLSIEIARESNWFNERNEE